MDISANFAFLEQEFSHAAESASYAEHHVYSDPRASCFHARHALEGLVKRVYRVDKDLTPPRTQNLDNYLSNPEFRDLVPQPVWLKADYIRKSGNKAVHGNQSPTPEMALSVVKELFHVLYWAGRTYLRKGAEELKGRKYDPDVIPSESGGTKATLQDLEALQSDRDAAEEGRKELETELEALREQLAQIKADNEAVPETHNWSEAETRDRIIDLDLHRAGWRLDKTEDREYEVQGMPNTKGVGYVDYVLWGDDGKPLAVVEAKKTSVDPKVGQQQAKLYADCLEQMHGQRPLIFYTNGYKTFLWDDMFYPPREVAGFYTKDELFSVITRRSQRKELSSTQIDDEIVERYYQKRAIGSIGEQFTQARRSSLLVMATGTGKTRMAIALVDQLQRAGWVKRVLFLADRVSLVNQAASAFKKHLPDSSPVNLVTDKDSTGRVYVSTYPTMMGLIDETKGSEARFGVGHFDLIIIDEAHRSVYQKYGAIFRYFDSLLVGLTATPREQIDRNTYELFGQEPGVPTDAYELDKAIEDGYLVPPKVAQIDMKFPREGIDYDSLTEEEKEQWESLDWGDVADERDMPDKVNAAAINSWLFNEDTIDKVLQYVMENGNTADGGDRLGKTIFFARNHEHALFIEERFNHHYPHYKGHFARIIDNYAKYPQSLIDDFSQKEKEPHIAISVDMMDTGIDVPEVVNLVFFKPVYSKIKFWQMIGRGTRLCPDLFGPGHDKTDFRIFDFCFNFDFFRENPDGIETSGAMPLGARLFQSRVQLLAWVQATPELDAENVLASSLVDGLFTEVAAMNRDNFIVRMHLEAVTKYQDRNAWATLKDADFAQLQGELAPLPTELELEEIEARLFDLTALRMQLAFAEGSMNAFETMRRKVVNIAMLLEEKTNVPGVKAQLEYLQAMQTEEFWEGLSLQLLEEMRLRLRGLMSSLDKKNKVVVYTDFEDEIMGVREDDPIPMPNMTGPEYEKKVKAYLAEHEDHLVIKRLKTNQPLTEKDLQGLEETLKEIGQEDGESLLSGLLARSESPSLAYFIRSMVGMDRSAAQSAFSQFLSDESLAPSQIRFVELVIDQLTSRGIMDSGSLYEAPFTSLHAGGPEELFQGKDNVINGIFKTLEQLQPQIESGAA